MKRALVAVALGLALSVLCALSIGFADGTAHAAFAGANGKIAYRAANDLYVVNPDGSGRRRVTRGQQLHEASWPAFSPDGKTIVYAFERYRRARGLDPARSYGTGLFVVQSDGSGRRRLTRGVDFMPTFSPDGTQIAFARSRRHGYSEIWVMNTDGSNKRRLTYLPGNDLDPVFSPDGSTIAWVRVGVDPEPMAIYLMNADGSSQRSITGSQEGVDYFDSPDFSPDGSHIVFGTFDCVCMMDTDGGDVRTLTPETTEAEQPAFSPDGRSIVVANGRTYDIEVMNVDGTHRRKVTGSGRALHTQPAWGVAPGP